MAAKGIMAVIPLTYRCGGKGGSALFTKNDMHVPTWYVMDSERLHAREVVQ